VNSRADVTSGGREYKGFEIHAQAPEGAAGYVPEVTLVRHNGDQVRERKFFPPVQAAFATEDEALGCAMEYAFALIDGDVEGIDPHTML
jgi:hypothetical protein